MAAIGLVLLTALLISAIGFKKYVWFLSVGYGYSIAAIGIMLLIRFREFLDEGLLMACILLILFGGWIGGYLTFLELHGQAGQAQEPEVLVEEKVLSPAVKGVIWVLTALLHTCESAPLVFRMQNGKSADLWLFGGVVIMTAGLAVEVAADLTRTSSARKRPGHFVSTGLYRTVRHPDYFGEILFWTGMFVSGINICRGTLQWAMCIAGYVVTLYIIFSTSRRRERRQNEVYAADPAYAVYAEHIPILIPFTKLHSLQKYRWLIG